MKEINDEVTLHDLLTEKKYKELSLKELSNLINNRLSYIEYKQLDGFLSDDKAKNLKRKWESESCLLSSAEKIEILNKMITWLQMNKCTDCYICNAFKESASELSYKAFECIPELLKYKPDKLFAKSVFSTADVWFEMTEKNKLKRINICRKTIRDILYTK